MKQKDIRTRVAEVEAELKPQRKEIIKECDASLIILAMLIAVAIYTGLLLLPRLMKWW